MDLWISLCCHFDVSDQLTTLINILNFLLQLPDDKDDGETNTTNHSSRCVIQRVTCLRSKMSEFGGTHPLFEIFVLQRSAPSAGKEPRRRRRRRRRRWRS